MSGQDLEQLLGGFAADTLTQEERQLLYRAALQDQELFNALADEQALKELLADPAVRRRLRDALNRTTAGAGEAGHWLDWLGRRAGLAYAGGLAAAALALLLGIRIYEDAFKHAGPTASPETSTPTSQPATAPPAAQPVPSPLTESPQEEAPAHSASVVQKTEAPTGTLGEPERSGPAKQQVSAASQALGDTIPLQGKELVTPPQTIEAPAAASSESLEEERAPANLKSAVDVAGPTAPPPQQQQSLTVPAGAPPTESKAPQPMTAPLAGAVASTMEKPSARALFYQAIQPPSESDRRMGAAQEAQSGIGSSGEQAPLGMRQAERERETARKRKSKKQSAGHPLGLRYSFLLRGRDGREVEMATLIASKGDHPRLTIETNDHGYLFAWYEERAGTASLFFPPPPPLPNKEQQPEGPEVTAGTRYVIPLPVGPMPEGIAPRGRLFILFSREPEMDITDLASVVERSKPGAKSLLIEHVDPSRPGAPDERAVYVVNPDPAANARLVVDIPLAPH